MRWAPLVAALVVAGCGGEAPQTVTGASTLERTLVDRDGNGTLEAGPAERLRDRTELAPARRSGRVLATVALIGDAHVRDEESPARVPFLDRYGDELSPAFRPQEALTAQVLAAAVRAVNGERPQATFVLGDTIDSTQRNELATALAVLDGGRVDAGSGAAGYRGVQEASNPDPFYYRPDVDPPRHAGLLEAAQRPFRAPGLRAPWFGVLGNHDILLAGETPPTSRSDTVAAGTRLVTSLPAGTELPEGVSRPELVDTLVSLTSGGRSITVPADPERRAMPAVETVRALARGRRTARAGRLDYAVDLGPRVRALVLDTVDRAGGSDPVADAALLAWLRGELARAAGRAVLVVAHEPLPESVLAVLDASPAVVATLTAHTHFNRITPRGRYWQISTASLADFPQQVRMLRVREAVGGGLVLETWMVDHDGRGLAGVSRELAFLDAQGGRPRGFAGAPGDRNARLFLAP